MLKRAAPSPCATLATALFLVSLFHSKNLLSSPDPLDAAPSRFATYDGVKVHYKSIGDPAAKIAVVYIHGWSGDLASWREQVPAFEGKARALFVDLPGHGKSDRPVVDYTMDRFAKAVEAVMRDAGVDRALFVGHSMGTPVARQFWRAFPKKTLGIVAVDGPLETFMTDPKKIRSFVDRFSGPDFGKVVSSFLEPMFVRSTPEGVKTSIRTTMAGATQHVAVSAMREMFDPAIWKNEPITVPLQVIVAKGPTWNADYFAAARALNPSTEIHEIPDSGHFVMMEKPAEVNALLVKFAAATGAIPMRLVRPGRPDDVSSAEAVVKAVYDVISGPAGRARDWERFRSLFVDGARLIPVGQRASGDFGTRVLDVEGYIARATTNFDKEGFYESEIARRGEAYRHIAHVLSTYEARHAPSDAKPFLRGINSFQLLFDGTRWWIVTIYWEAESEGERIPPAYLPKS